MVTLEELNTRIDNSGLTDEVKAKAKAVVSGEYESDFPELGAMTVDLYLKTYEEAAKDNYDPIAETFTLRDNDANVPAKVQFERELKDAQLRFLVDAENTSGLTLIQRCFHAQELQKHMDEGVKLVASALLTSAYPSDKEFEEARERVINEELKNIRERAEQGDVD